MVYHISYLHFSKHAPLVGAICHLALALLYGSVKKKKTSLYLQKCPLHCIIKMYRYFTLKIFTKSFARLQCVILHTRHTLLSKNDLHVVTICNDSSKFVNSLHVL